MQPGRSFGVCVVADNPAILNGQRGSFGVALLLFLPGDGVIANSKQSRIR
jgi:hypothetical protein